MSKNIVIQAELISKHYRLGKIGTGSFTQDIQRWMASLKGKEDPLLKVAVENKRDIKGAENIWALKDISFSVEKGEILGIIGRNGAGKSTLLKILSGITSPSTGQLKIKGRIASLLEVGTGFHPELSGRENIFLNGSILGMKKSEIVKKFDEIVEFSGVANFIDTPVKRYSSGMRVRLGFAVAAHLEPEILVVDEVLAVGDAEFQKKAIGKMKEVSANGGRTVLFVSHNLASLRRLCTQGLLLENGRQTFQGDIESTIKKYNESSMAGGEKQDSKIRWLENFPGNKELELHEVSIQSKSQLKNSFSSNEEIEISCLIKLNTPVRNFRFNLQVLTLADDIMFTSTSHNIEPGLKEIGTYVYKIKLPKDFFNKDSYKIRLISDVNAQRIILFPIDVLEFSIVEVEGISSYSFDVLPGFTCPKILWEFEKE